jgi:hypothetical protein
MKPHFKEVSPNGYETSWVPIPSEVTFVKGIRALSQFLPSDVEKTSKDCYEMTFKH